MYMPLKDFAHSAKYRNWVEIIAVLKLSSLVYWSDLGLLPFLGYFASLNAKVADPSEGCCYVLCRYSKKFSVDSIHTTSRVWK